MAKRNIVIGNWGADLFVDLLGWGWHLILLSGVFAIGFAVAPFSAEANTGTRSASCPR